MSADGKGAEVLSRNEFFIGGAWVAPSTDRKFTLVNASTGEILGTAPEAMEADVDRAVAAARKAFDDPNGWSKWAPAKRAEVMTRFSDALKKRAPDLARLVSLQNGMPIGLSTQLEAAFSFGIFDYYAQLASTMVVDEVRPSQMGRETRVSRHAIGVVAGIVPWNFPVALALTKVGPSMASGCTLVLKPSPGTVLDSYLMAEAALEAGVPPGVLNWVPADRAVGAYLVSHPGVDKVAFTGSTLAGRSIAATCGQLLRPVTLELGGKSAAIVLEDANFDEVMQGLQMASLMNNGQACINGTRVLAPKSRYKDFVDALATMTSGLKVGNAVDATTQVGPMASAAHRDRVEGYITKGKSEARLVSGGGKVKDVPAGWFVQPTVFADVSNSAVIAQEEIFGPVLSVIPYKDEADAVRLANDSMYGLGGSVWSSDTEHGARVAKQVQTGSIGVNGYMLSIGSPFGGVKASGIGRELGPEALGHYMQWKSTFIMS